MPFGAVWRLQGEIGIPGRSGPTGPVGIGEPGLPVSILNNVLYKFMHQRLEQSLENKYMQIYQELLLLTTSFKNK